MNTKSMLPNNRGNKFRTPKTDHPLFILSGLPFAGPTVVGGAAKGALVSIAIAALFVEKGVVYWKCCS